MGRVSTEIVEDAHAYTRSEVPWSISTVTAKSPRSRLFNYISGGGMRTFGRTVRQEEVRRKQLRFLAVAAVLAAVWFLLLVF